MKRKQAVKEIIISLFDISFGEILLTEKQADKLLSTIENDNIIGMLPPKRIPTPKELNLENEPDLYEEYIMFNEYRSWEK